MAEDSGRRGGFASTVAKKALAPLVTTAATAGAAYLTEKGKTLWEQKLQPKLQERGGSKAAAKEALGTVAEKVSPAREALGTVAEKVSPATDKLEALATKVREGPDADASDSQEPAGGATSDPKREAERSARAQRREQRRKTLKEAGSS